MKILTHNVLTVISLLFLSITVFSQDNVSFIIAGDGKDVGCSPFKVVFINTSQVAGDVNYTWHSSDGKESVLDTVYWTFRDNAGDFTITLEARNNDDNSLIGAYTKTITVAPSPVVHFTVDRDHICNNNSVTFTPVIISANSPIKEYQWFFDDGVKKSYDKSPTHVYDFYKPDEQETTIYPNLSVKDSLGCVTSDDQVYSLPINVKLQNAPTPYITSSAGQSVTCDETFSTTFTYDNYDSDITNYTWYVNDVEVPNQTLSLSQTFTRAPDEDFVLHGVKLVAENVYGCESDPQSVSVRMYNFQPEIILKDTATGTYLDESKNLCGGAISISTKKYLSIEWDYNNDGIIDGTQQEDTVAFFKEGNNPVMLIAKNYGLSENPICVDTVYKDIVVEGSIVPTLNLSKDFNCEETVLSVSMSSEISGSSFYILPSDSEEAYNSSSIEDTVYGGERTYKGWAISPSGCYSDTVEKSFYVETPHAFFKVDMPKNRCIPMNVVFTDSSTYDPQYFDDKIVNYLWDFEGDGTVDFSGNTVTNHTFTVAGEYPSMLTVVTELGCESSYIIDIDDRLLPVPITVGSLDYLHLNSADAFHVYEDTICASQAASLSMLTNLSSVFDTLLVGMKTVNYTVGQTITGSDLKAPQTSVSGWDTIGTWHFSTVYMSHLGCHDQFVGKLDSVYVKGPIVDLEASHSCGDGNNYSIALTKNIASTEFNWYINGKLIDSLKDVASYTYAFKELGDYTIAVEAYNENTGCFYNNQLKSPLQVRKLNVVYEPPVRGFCINDTLVILKNHLSNTTTGDDSDLLDFSWRLRYPTYNEGHEDSVGYIVEDSLFFTEYGDYYVWLKTRDLNGCEDSTINYFRVYQPEAQFEFTNISGCLPLDVTLKNTTNEASPDTAIASFQWFLADTLYSTDREISFSYESENTANVKLKVVNIVGCIDSISYDSLITPIVPSNKIEALFPRVCKGVDADVPFEFEALQNVDMAHWNFNNGDIEFDITDPNFTMNLKAYDEGTYPVTFNSFIYTDTDTCSNDTTIDITIKNIEVGIISEIGDIYNGCTQAEFIFNNKTDYSDDDNILYYWYIKDPDEDNNDDLNSTDKIPYEHLGYGEGEYIARLKIKTDYFGCETQEDTLVKFIGKISPKIDIKDTVCIGQDVAMNVLQDADILKLWGFEWDFGDGSKYDTVNMNTVHAYESAKFSNAYQVFLSPSDRKYLSCIDASAKVSDTVYLYEIEADFIFTDKPEDNEFGGCQPLQIPVTNTSIGALTQTWDYGDGRTQSVENVDTIVFEDAGEYDLVLSIQGNECTDAISKHISVYPKPSIDLQIESHLVCRDSSRVLHLNGDNGLEIVWSPQDYMDLTDIQNPVITPEKDIMYSVYAKETVHNCDISDSIAVTVRQKPHYLGAPENWLVRLPIYDTLENITPNILYINEVYNVNNDSISGVSYAWTALDGEEGEGLSCTNCASPDITITRDMTYQLLMVDSDSCFAIDTVIAFVLGLDSRIKVTSAFTPNGDDVNDRAYARGWGIKEFISLKIYNRWGQLMFETEDFYEGWDGKYKGNPQNADTYTYIAKAIDHRGEEIIEKGYVTLLR